MLFSFRVTTSTRREFTIFVSTRHSSLESYSGGPDNFRLFHRGVFAGTESRNDRRADNRFRVVKFDVFSIPVHFRLWQTEWRGDGAFATSAQRLKHFGDIQLLGHSSKRHSRSAVVSSAMELMRSGMHRSSGFTLNRQSKSPYALHDGNFVI